MSIFRVGNSYAITRLAVEVSGFLTTSTRGHLVSILFDIVS
jgi:hypothetical protein